jgi:anti-sigma factor RsiW
MNADILHDFALGRIYGQERRRLKRDIARDGGAAAALGRVRATMRALRAGLGGLDAIPPEWLDLLARYERRRAMRPMHPDELARERAKTWL